MSYYQQLLERHNIQLKPEHKAAWSGVLTRESSREPKLTAFDEDGRRICCVCRESKDPDQFSVDKNRADGRDARCKTCKAQIAKRYKK